MQSKMLTLLLGEVFATFGEGFAKQKCIKFTKQFKIAPYFWERFLYYKWTIK